MDKGVRGESIDTTMSGIGAGDDGKEAKLYRENTSQIQELLTVVFTR